MKYAGLLLLLVLLPVQAEIYRWVDESGNVVFSDKSQPGAEKVELQPATTYTPVESGTDNTFTPPPNEYEEQIQSVKPDYRIRILAPANDESIWVNNGDVTVSMIIEPALDTARGDKIVLKLDGQVVAESHAGTRFQLKNLSRGTHSLAAMVVDDRGNILARTDELVFHLHRASILNNPRHDGATPPGPTGGLPSSSSGNP